MRRVLTFVVFLAVGSAAKSVPLQCYQNPKTDAVQCVNDKRVTERDGIRIAQLWTGGPDNIRETNFRLFVNCSTGVVHLKDRDGVSFAGGNGRETPAIIELKSIVCGAKVRK